MAGTERSFRRGPACFSRSRAPGPRSDFFNRVYYRRKRRKLQERGGGGGAGYPPKCEVFEISASQPCKNRALFSPAPAEADSGPTPCPPVECGEKPGKPGRKVKAEVIAGKMQVDFRLIAILHIDKALVSR